MHAARGSTHHLKSAVRAVHILTTIEQSGSARLSELSAAFGLSKATAFRTLETLVAERVLRKDRQTGLYAADRASWVYLSLFHAPIDRLLASVQDALDQLSGSTTLTSSVVLPLPGRRDAATAMYSAPHVAASYAPARRPDTAPLHASAAGKCYLAALPEDSLTWYLQRPLVTCTDRTITSPGSLRTELARVRRQGHALNSGEVVTGASAVAVPLPRSDDTVLGGVALTVPRNSLTQRDARDLLAPLRDATRRISVQMSPESWSLLVDESPSVPGGPPSPWGEVESASGADAIPRVRTVVRMVRLTGYLMMHPQGASLAELAEARGLRKQTAWRLLNSLQVSGCVQQDVPTRRYRIDPVFWLRRARLLRAAGTLAEATRGALRDLADETGATAILELPDRGHRHSVAYQFELPDSPVCWRAQHAPPSPLHATAAGKVYLAAQPRLAVNEYMGRGLEAVTAKTITSSECLLRELESVRRHGYALSQGERDSGASALSVPVYDSTGTVVGAVTVVRLVSALTDADVRRELPRVRQAAERITRFLVADWREQLEQAHALR